MVGGKRMAKKVPLRVRRSLKALQDDYENGKKKPLETLMRAWKGIKELPPDDRNSFFMIGGYHGEPFRGAGWGKPPTGAAIATTATSCSRPGTGSTCCGSRRRCRAFPAVPDVMMPYWDETSQESLTGGIPWALTQKDFVLDGETIPNPLRSFVLTVNIVDTQPRKTPTTASPRAMRRCAIRCPAWSAPKTRSQRRSSTTPSSPTTTRTWGS